MALKLDTKDSTLMQSFYYLYLSDSYHYQKQPTVFLYIKMYL